MPNVEVEGAGTFDVEEGRRLVLAIEEDAGVEILHRCGGYARCTTCRVEYLEGEPDKMTMSSTGAVSPGKKPEPYVTPEPEWVVQPAGATP